MRATSRLKSIDKITRRWIRNKIDERAALDYGCRFNEERAAHVCDFFQSHLVLYEGAEYAGQLIKLMPWQVEFLSQAFGWEIWSDDWQRWVRRFNTVFCWCPKKQGKSPLAAGVGLYHLVADGEQGNHVHLAARDGKQARIMMKHAHAFVNSSPNLAAACTIVKRDGSIIHHETQSDFAVVSGDNIKGQEGLNGSGLIIDECHVVNRKLAKTLEHLGASRSEPMQFGVSTAGNDPDGWGYGQYDYGKKVAAGLIHDIHFLHVFYGVDETAGPDVLANPKTWKAANPSWGHTIKPAEFKTRHDRALGQGIADYNEFCMYRLNRWQRALSPWLPYHKWVANGRRFSLDKKTQRPTGLAGRRHGQDKRPVWTGVHAEAERQAGRRGSGGPLEAALMELHQPRIRGSQCREAAAAGRVGRVRRPGCMRGIHDQAERDSRRH